MATILVQLQIGQLAASTQPKVISTVLGSCVSVCLFSPNEKVGGMIHFALPSAEIPNGDRQDLRYADVAIPQLIRQLCKLSARRPHELRAKLVGGAAVVEQLHYGSEIGVKNIRKAEELLRAAGIPIIGQDVGGNRGRKVLFYTDSGRVRVSLIEKTEAPQVIPSLQKKKVLIVDDSRTIRQLLVQIIEKDPRLCVAGVAPDAFEAEKLIRQLSPDVLTLDIHMPKMDGVTFLEKMLSKRPIPAVMITSISRQESDHVIRALELGAVDYIQKPSLNELSEMAPVICEKIFHAAQVKKIRASSVTPARPPVRSHVLSHSMIVAIGASTGGTEALKELLVRLPKNIPPTVIVQHIPPVFSLAFANRLNQLCAFRVKEAEDGDCLEPELALIAPGGRQMEIRPAGGKLRVRLTDDPPVNRHKPSVDYLFDSVAKHVGRKAIGMILTGMGNDGAKGLLKMKAAGARTMCQDEESCVVYGMPKAAVELGAAQEVHSLEKMPDVLLKWLAKSEAA